MRSAEDIHFVRTQLWSVLRTIETTARLVIDEFPLIIITMKAQEGKFVVEFEDNIFEFSNSFDVGNSLEKVLRALSEYEPSNLMYRVQACTACTNFEIRFDRSSDDNVRDRCIMTCLSIEQGNTDNIESWRIGGNGCKHYTPIGNTRDPGDPDYIVEHGEMIDYTIDIEDEHDEETEEEEGGDFEIDTDSSEGY